jgi:hypothetical protein
MRTKNRNYQIHALYCFFASKGYSNAVITAFLGKEFCLKDTYIATIVTNYKQEATPQYADCILLYRIIFDGQHKPAKLYTNILTHNDNKLEIITLWVKN